jgi:hypothetical protein
LDSLRLQLTVLDGGKVVVAFTWATGGSFLMGNDLAGLVTASRVSFTTKNLADIRLCPLKNGNLLVVFLAYNSGYSMRFVYARVYSSAGTAVTGEISVSGTTSNFLDISVAPFGMGQARVCYRDEYNLEAICKVYDPSTSFGAVFNPVPVENVIIDPNVVNCPNENWWLTYKL